jgi:peptidoglycan/LPS O-acetylase OafA/YrhL
MNSVGVSFCFVYSGYFTARRHTFGRGYGLKEHLAFLRDKLARLYPLHVLAVVLSIVVAILSWGGAVSLKILLAHLTLTSSWIPDPAYYIGANPVAWFVCDLFFLYLMAPIVVRTLGRLAPLWQVVLMAVLLLLEFVGGAIANAHSGSDFLNIYVPYQFPPIRLLDFATGVVIYNVGHTQAWKRLQEFLTPRASTIAEVVALLLFVVFYKVGKDVIHTHCYRAYCASAPAIVVLFTTFIMTSNRPGALSRLLCLKPLAHLSRVSAEVYLLQFGVYFLTECLCKPLGIYQKPLPYFLIQMTVLLLTAWVIHRYYVSPLNRWLRSPKRA